MVKNVCFSMKRTPAPIPSHSIVVSSFCSSVVFFGCDVKGNATSKVFTDLSGLATRDYSLTFNRPIRLFMEGGTRRAAALTCYTHHSHCKLNCLVITAIPKKKGSKTSG